MITTSFSKDTGVDALYSAREAEDETLPKGARVEVTAAFACGDHGARLDSGAYRVIATAENRRDRVTLEFPPMRAGETVTGSGLVLSALFDLLSPGEFMHITARGAWQGTGSERVLIVESWTLTIWTGLRDSGCDIESSVYRGGWSRP